MSGQRAVVVGASLAGLRAAEALRREGHDGPLTIVGDEPELPYDRPPLSKQILTGKAGPEDVALGIEEGLEADWLLDTTATRLNLAANHITLGDGTSLPFDLLVIATGASPRRIPGLDPGPGIHYLRTIGDSVRLRDELESASGVVVIGAGFIGLEVASSAHQRGLDVTVLEALPVPLERAIGAEMGHVVAELHRSNGIDLKLNASVARVGPEGVELNDGTVVPADVVVVGIGVAPNTSWLEGSGIDLQDGVVCDHRLRVQAHGRTVPHIVAAGDVARWSHLDGTARVEHWTNAAEQGEAAGFALLRGDEAPHYAPVPYFWSDQHGAKIQFVGHADPGDEVLIVDGDPAEGRFVAAYGRDGKLVAALGVRRPAKVMAMQRLIADGAVFPPQD